MTLLAHFEIPEWTAFLNIDGLQRSAGASAAMLARVAVKEVTDNALDASGGPVSVMTNGRVVHVSDDGPGLSREQIIALFSVTRPRTTSKLMRMGGRGALGNGLRVAVGVVHASGGGYITVASRGRLLALAVGSHGETIVTEERESKVTVGTRVSLVFGSKLSLNDIASDAALATRFPGRTLTVEKPSPSWFGTDAFRELARVTGETADVLAERFNLRRRLRLTPDPISDSNAATILASLVAAEERVTPKAINPLGDDAFHGVYERSAGMVDLPGGGIVPALTEVWVWASRAKKGEAAANVRRLVLNRTPALATVHARWESGCLQLGTDAYILAKAPAARYEIYLAVSTPFAPIMSDGKAPILSAFVDLISPALSKAARKAHHALAKPPGEKRNFLERCRPHVVDAYLHASDGGRLPVEARMIMYQTRARVFAAGWTGSFDDKKFTTDILPQLMFEDPDNLPDDRIHFGARGFLQEPHDGRRVESGTRDVHRYREGPECNDLVDEQVLRYPTHGARNRFGAVLFVEKEGLMPILEDAGIPDRFDIALATSKGVSNVAIRKLLDYLGNDRPHLKVFVLHDFDAAGFKIAASLRGSWRYEVTAPIEWHDAGLRLDDVLAMGLESEPGTVAKEQTLEGYGCTDEEIEFLANRKQRVELNAMTAAQLVELIERKLIEAGVAKVIPDPATLESAHRMLLARRMVHRQLERLQAEANRAAEQVPVPEDLREQVTAFLTEDQSLAWDDAVARLLQQSDD